MEFLQLPTPEQLSNKKETKYLHNENVVFIFATMQLFQEA